MPSLRQLRPALFLAAACAFSAERVPFRHIVVDPHPPLRPHCKTVGDLNGDKLPDIAAASDAGDGLFWYAAPDWTKRRIDTGAFTTDMQAADLDGDGDLDLVIPKYDVGVVWYENPGPKGQTWRRRVVDAERAHDVEVADMDGDGKLDLVVRWGDTRVLLQRPKNEWLRIDIKTGGRGGVSLADLDGDKRPDIVQNGYWLRNPGGDLRGPWERLVFAAGGPDDCGVLVTDINRDGRPDILIAPAETTGRLSWYESATPRTGPWTEHVIDPDVAFVHTFKSGDVDRDGHPDVVIAEMEQSAHGRIAVYYNHGKASGWTRQIVGREGSHNIRLADIGNDGDLDIVGANHGQHGVATPIEMWENLSRSPAPPLPLTRWRRHVVDGDRPWRAVFIAPADLDGDGRPDIVSGGWWYRNPGAAGGIWVRRAVGEGFHNFALAYDFDGDGMRDLLGTRGKGSERNPEMLWAQNDGKGNFKLHRNIPKPDGDFLQGIAAIRTSPRGVIQIPLSWHAAGKGVQLLSVPRGKPFDPWTLERISEHSQDEALSVGDIVRGRRLLDILQGTSWLRFDGKQWTRQRIAAGEGDPDRNRLADINGDGRLDAIVGFEAINKPGKLAWYEQPAGASGLWTEHPIGNPVGPMSLDVADLDRDGDFDVVAGEHNYADPASARLHIFENLDGKGGRWKDHVVSTGDEHHDGAQLVDIDGDGDLDAISLGWSHPRVLLYENLAIDRAAAPAPAGRFHREHWFTPGAETGNFPVTARFRVNAPEAVLHPSWGPRRETKASGMMQIRFPEDLFALDGAELYAELWGGHHHTTDKRVTLNGRSTYLVPEVGTAEGSSTHEYPTFGLKLTDLVNGWNALQWACDQGSSFWGHFIVDEAALRAYLRRDHPDLQKAGLAGFEARVSARPVPGREALALKLETSGAAPRIESVAFQGWYDGYDDSGQGRTAGWHGFTKNRRPVAYLPETWDTGMLPDQKAVSVRALVRFAGHPGLVYASPATDNIPLPARAPKVKQYVSKNLPTRFVSRADRRLGCDIELDVDPARIERAELHTVVWDGGRGKVEDYFTFNGRPLKVAGEGAHDVIYTVLPIDPAWLKQGANRIELRSDTEHHGIEILLPGPALVVRTRP
ncbi:MAG: VCBS repeat-containing protein [Gemmataceae bacterium]|nr:VCBS repeat-containing protein [Gemmataceae bacterium]